MMAAGGIERSLRWLASQQEKNGGFSGYAGSSIRDLKPERKHETIFFTALILVCLEGVKGSEIIAGPAIEFLISNRSELGWNYWTKRSPQAAEMPFPDDLDDTAYALLAISKHQPEYVDGRVLAEVVKLLLASEVKPGGPYRTWLVQPSLYDQWGDTDLAVNANIGALLAQHGIKMPALEAYIETKLSGKLQSSYYIGEIPILYFLSRWYRGGQLKKLKQRVAMALKNELKQSNALWLAMLVSAGCRVGLGKNELSQAADKLLSLKIAEHWPAEALYPEPIVKDVHYYAGSQALTTAFALEALQAYGSYDQPAKSLKSETQHLGLETARLNGEIKRAYVQAANKIVAGPARTQIAKMADLTARAYGQQIDPGILDSLNQASINGWIAYSIYDDFYDQEAEPADLALANFAARQSQGYYAAVADDEFQDLVRNTFNAMDTANRWEVLNARAGIDGQELRYSLPNYGQHQKLAERSWGHMLASTGVLTTLGYGLDSMQSKKLRRFFHHFLIARQLNDDAHDWLDDLQRGHLSAVNCLLLKEYGSDGVINMGRQEGELKLKFWQQTIFQVNELIGLHLHKAQRALKGAGMKDSRKFQSWLDALEVAAGQAVDVSRQAQHFIETYKNKPND